MRTLFPWVGLLIILALSIFEPFGLEVAGGNDPITSTDLFLWFALLAFIVMIEARDAANYVVKQLKSK